MTQIDRTVDENLRILLSMLPAVRDGNADAIHDARVATRRIRAAAPLAWAFQPEEHWSEPLDAIRDLGRSFGRARDLDVALERLTELEARLPIAARSLASLRQTLTARQEKSRRRLIKTIEGLPLESLGGLRFTRPRFTFQRDRRGRVLEQNLAEQATDLEQAIERAPGVYFPNRSHQVRVSVKKLRYLLELLPRRAQPARTLKRLRRAQELLGELHDRQFLADLIDEVKAASSDREQYDPALALLAAERRDRFAAYLAQREELLRIAGEISRSNDGRASRQQIVTRSLLIAGVVMAPSTVSAIARRSHANGARPTPPVPKRHSPQLSSAHAYAASGTSSPGSRRGAAVAPAPSGAEHHGSPSGERSG